MKVTDYHQIPLEVVDMDDTKNVKVRWLIDDRDKAEKFAMRFFEIEPGGFTPYHMHDWEHEMFVLEGEGEVKIDRTVYPIRKDIVIFIEPNQKHGFKNTGNSLLKFLCLIPYKK